MVKKWFADYKNKIRPEDLKNKFLLLFLSNFRPCISVKLYTTSLFKCRFFFHLITSCHRCMTFFQDQQQNITGWSKSMTFPGLFMFLPFIQWHFKAWNIFFKFNDFSRFQGPVGTMKILFMTTHMVIHTKVTFQSHSLLCSIWHTMKQTTSAMNFAAASNVDEQLLMMES